MSRAINDMLLDDGIDLQNERIILFGAVDVNMLRRLIMGLSLLNKAASKKAPSPITVVLSTYGGDADIALGIYDLIKNNARPVHVCAIGPCMSAGSIILQAGRRRVSLPSTTFLFHFGDESAGSKAERCMNETRTAYWNGIIADRSGASMKLVDQWHAGETFFTAPEALKFNLIDKIVERI